MEWSGESGASAAFSCFVSYKCLLSNLSSGFPMYKPQWTNILLIGGGLKSQYLEKSRLLFYIIIVMENLETISKE